MTQNEFVKKESKYYLVLSETRDMEENFSDGLAKGLEVAKELLDFAVNKFFSVERLDGKIYFAKLTKTQKIQYLTTDELLTIFLTEKYGK